MDERQICIAYVDYENLVEALSHHNSLDIVTLLNHLLERARQQFRIQRILLFGNWALYALPAQIDTRGIVRRVCSNPGDPSLEIEQSIIQGLSGKESCDIYLLISGQARYLRVLKRLYQANKRSVLWTLFPLSEQEEAWSSGHEIIALPPTLIRQKVPRSLLLQALVLETATSCARRNEVLTWPELRDDLQQYTFLQAEADRLISLALRERILFLREAVDPLQDPQISLNRRHEMTRRALLTQDRILNTVRVLQEKRGWVAFSTLDKALGTYYWLADNQPLRQHWIELLVTLGRLSSSRRTHPGTSLVTTTLWLNSADPPASSELLARQNLITLICVMNSLWYRRTRAWISVAQLQRRLTTHMTCAEARATVEQARAEQILLCETRPGKRNPERSITVVGENQQHPFVQEMLALRDRLLLTGHALLVQRNLRSSESLLLEEFCATERLAEDDALYWLRLLTREGYARIKPLEAQVSTGEHIVSLTLDDPLVRHLLADVQQHTLEREAREHE
ncbi:MAG TPA: hypothetical protein VGF67_21455 [Ktedonobacteraceae bacterium]|jgi:hypothetical protein